MIENYLKTAWRNLVRNKIFSLINVLGLSLGLACSLLIMLWVNDEKSVDTFHKNSRQLFQVYERSYYDGKIDASYPTQGMLAEELKKNVPQIEFASGLESASGPGMQSTFKAANKVDKMNGVFAGDDFFTMFSFPMLAGGVATAIRNPSSIAISHKMADIFFGGAQNAIGKTILFDDKESLLVTAVFENTSQHSSLQFDFVRSWSDFVTQNDWVHNWGDTDPQTFVQLRKDAKAENVESQIKNFISRYQAQTKALKTELALQPFGERYLYSHFKDGYIDGGRIEYVRLLSIIAAFVLLIACINFMSLTTARSARRAREVGVRKVIGALRFSLIKQFMGETLLVTGIAIIMALLLVVLTLPVFNAVTGKDIVLPVNHTGFWLRILVLLVITGILAGSYPAFFMSSFRPIRVLKGPVKFSWQNLFLRKGLVVFQFALSVMLIVATIVIYRQMQYIQHKNLGYNRENLLYIPIEGNLTAKYDVFKEEALANTSIVSVSKMRNSPTVISHHTFSIYWTAKDPNLNVPFADGVVGYDFIKTMGLQLASGRDFSKAYNDSLSFILNETAVNKIGFKNPIGQQITWGQHTGKIVGEIKDFHFNSLHEKIEPLIMRLDENWTWGTILVRIKGGLVKRAIESLQKICSQLNPDFPFTYQFSDLEYGKLYKSEEVISKLSGLFSFLAIFISCLGLFGLALFAADQRNKEIGIRKVLGASAMSIVTLLSMNFLKPILMAFLIAFPVSWFAMKHWLRDFAYRINIGWATFIIAGTVALLIALLTVSFQSIKAAVANPAKSLRTE